jgi:ADP-heptose:LPS heptosyltransferase
MAFFLKAAGVRTTFGRNTEGKGFFYSRKIDEYSSGDFNQAHYFNALAEAFTGNPVTVNTGPWVSAEDEASVSALLNSWNFSQSDKIMIINPGSDRLTRRWQSVYFAEVLDYFALNYNLIPVIVGSANEEPLSAEIASLSKAKTYSAAGKLSIGALISLVKRSKILFTTNSAAMHAAGVSDLPFVSLAGSGDPAKDKPEGDRSKMSLLWKKIHCNPCDYYRCPENNYMECMNVLTPKEVIAEGKRLLDRG